MFPIAELDSDEKVLVQLEMVVEVKDNLPKKTFHKVQGEVLLVAERKASPRCGNTRHRSKLTFASREHTLPPDFEIACRFIFC